MKRRLHSNTGRLLAALSVAAFSAAALTAGCGEASQVAPSEVLQAASQGDGGSTQLLKAERAAEVDLTWYNGEEYQLLFPSAGSANENQFTFGCFNLGPDQTNKVRGRVGTLYGVIVEGTTHDSCPDGSIQHDHVVSAVPGVPGYSTFWEVVFVQPGPAFDPAIIPLTSESAIFSAEAAGQVVLTPAGFVVKASIVGTAD